MLIDGFVDRLMLTGKPELWQLWWKVPLASVSFENAVSPCVLRNCLNCRWCRGKVSNLTTKGPLCVYHFLCQLPFTFFGRQSLCYCCFELGSLAMPRKLYWTKKILANALHRLGAQYHVHVLSSDRKIHTHVMFTFFAKLSPWWFAVCLLSSLWSWVVFQTV